MNWGWSKRGTPGRSSAHTGLGSKQPCWSEMWEAPWTVDRRELVSSQRLLKPLSIRGLGCQHGELRPTQSARRRCYSQASSLHLSPTSHQSLSPALIYLLNTPCCPSSSPPTDPPQPGPGPQLLHGIVPRPLWAVSLRPLPPCAAARVDL